MGGVAPGIDSSKLTDSRARGSMKKAGDICSSILTTMPRIEVSKASCPSAHSSGNKIARVLWAIVQATVFRWSPRVCFGWRRMLLRIFGATVGRNARISPSVKVWGPWNLTVGNEASIAHDVDCYCVDRINIGSHATVSQYAFLCTASHDVTDPHMRLVTGPILIADQAWVCAGAYVAMGLIIGEGAVVAARSVVTRSVDPWMIVAGNPARVIKRRQIQNSPGSDSRLLNPES